MLDTNATDLLQAAHIKGAKGLTFALVKQDIEEAYDIDWLELREVNPELVMQIFKAWQQSYQYGYLH